MKGLVACSLIVMAAFLAVRVARMKIEAAPVVVEGLAGTVKEADVVVRNGSWRPLIAYGSQQGCGLPRVCGVPKTLEPGQTATLKLQVFMPEQSSQLEGILFTDAGEIPIVVHAKVL